MERSLKFGQISQIDAMEHGMRLTDYSRQYSRFHISYIKTVNQLDQGMAS